MPGLANLQFRDPLSRMDSANLEGMAGLLGMWANNEQRNAQTQQAQAIENNSYQNIQDAIATRQAQALDNPADIDILRRGKLGQALSQDATGRYDQGVLPGRIATANAENKTKLSAAQLEDMVHQLDIATSILEVNGPASLAAIQDEGLRNKIAQEKERTGKSPLQIVQAMSNAVKSALANSPKFMADANIKAIEGNNQMNVKALDNQGALNVANVREKGDSARHTDTTTRETIRANSALIANLQRENKDLSDQVGMIQILDPKGTNKEYQAKAVAMASRIKENQRIMSAIRNNMKADYVPTAEETAPKKATKEIVTKSGKRVTVESD